MPQLSVPVLLMATVPAVEEIPLLQGKGPVKVAVEEEREAQCLNKQMQSCAKGREIFQVLQCMVLKQCIRHISSTVIIHLVGVEGPQLLQFQN